MEAYCVVTRVMFVKCAPMKQSYILISIFSTLIFDSVANKLSKTWIFTASLGEEDDNKQNHADVFIKAF